MKSKTIQQTKEGLGRLWPKFTPGKLALLYSINPNFGKTAVFNQERPELDSGANMNKCFNILPFFCGNKTNIIANDQKQEIIERTVTDMIFYAKGEQTQRREYKITIDVWNFNAYWMNQCLFTLILGILAFTINFRRSTNTIRIQEEASKGLDKIKNNLMNNVLAKFGTMSNPGIMNLANI